MNPQSLHALIIDRHFGELTPEAAELLEHHLAQNPASRAEAERILDSLAVTGDAMLQHPELARVASPQKAKTTSLWRPAFTTWMMRAAMLTLLAAAAAAAGFFAGRSGASSRPEPRIIAASSPPAQPPNSGPWARYRMTFDPTGSGMQVVRVDVPHAKSNALR